MGILKKSLFGNAIFSFLSGFSLLLFSNKIIEIFQVGSPAIYLTIGAVLVLFASLVLSQAIKPKIGLVLFIILQDFLWVLGSAFIVFFKPFGITSSGHQVIAAIAFVVLFFGIGQSVGLAQSGPMAFMEGKKEKGMKQLSYQRIIKASKEKVWKAVSDVSNYHKVAPNVDAVEIISGEDEGMVRSCSHKTDSWTEVATLWEEGEQYSFKVNTEAEDYPFPLQYLTGNWKVEEIAENQTKITMTFDFKYNKKIQSLLLHPFMKIKFGKICRELLDNWQAELEQ